MKLSLKGQYWDTTRDSDGRGFVQTPPRANVVVYRALDLIAELLRNQPGLDGILYWAVGSGDPKWDQSPPTTDRRTSQLVNEIYRQPVDPARHITYDADKQTLVIRMTFEANEAVGVWREFGLFGGDASARPDSGYLINHAIHPAIDKTEPVVLERELQLTLSSDVAVGRGLDLIAGLLRNEPGLSGIQYWAVGTGDPDWDETPPTPDREATQLEKEIYRKPVDPARHITYDEDTRTLVVRTTFSFDEAVGVLREFGLFGGDASLEPDSGYLINHEIHPAIDKTLPLVLEREFRLTLGSDVVVEVPDLIEMTVDAAQTALENENLTLGAVLEAESEEEAGQVIAQDPPTGDLVSEGAAVDVTVTVSIRVDVPDVRGLTPADATTVLADADLVLSDETPALEESPATPGTIIRQTPPAGARVAPGTVVRVVLATPITTVVPPLTGLTAGEAEVVLRKAELTLAPAPHPVRGSTGAYGTVVDQYPTANEQVPVKTAVTIVLAAPWTVEVPDLTGLKPEDAADALREATAELLETLGRPPEPPGLALGAQTTRESEATEGTIVGQKPAAGDRAPLYGTVDIELATLVTAKVPDLIGLNVEEAGVTLEEAGLVLEVIKRRPDVTREGTVIEQEPRAGVRAPRGSAVNVVLAEPILVEVPDLIERPLEYAREVVLSRGLVLGQPTWRIMDLPERPVIQQDPEPGRPVALRSTVTVEAAILREEAVEVPPVVGLHVEEAEVRLGEVGLKLVVGEERQSGAPASTVLEQTPAAGEPAPVESTVTVVVAIPPEEAVEVPSVVELQVEEAKEVLAQVGLTLAEPPYPEAVSNQPVGTIIRQDPEAGVFAAVGDIVSIVLAARVPNVVGRTLDEAVAILEAVGLTLTMPPAEEESDQPERTIIRQDPPAGSIAEVGSAVAVVVAVPAVVITGITPTSARRGTTVDAVILGNSLDRATAVKFFRDAQQDARVVATIGEVVTPDRLPVEIRVKGNAAYGDRSFTVTTPAGTAQSPPDVVFTVVQEAERLIEDMEILDDFTLWIRLTRPTPDFPALLTNLGPYALVSPRALEELGEEIAKRPVGTGPFVFKEWETGEVILLTPNERYWGHDQIWAHNEKYWGNGAQPRHTLIFVFIRDAAALLAQLVAGDIDMFDTQDPELAEAAEQMGMRVAPVKRFYKDERAFLIFGSHIEGDFLSPGGLHLEFVVNRQTPEKLTYASQEEPRTFDPLWMQDTASLKIATQILDGLTGYQPKEKKVLPHLAEEWESGDGLEWTFKLRQDVTFHDQVPFTAEAVAINFRRLLEG